MRCMEEKIKGPFQGSLLLPLKLNRQVCFHVYTMNIYIYIYVYVHIYIYMYFFIICFLCIY